MTVNKPNVLLTGADSFLAAHILRILLEQNYNVRATASSLSNALYLRKHFKSALLTLAIIPNPSKPGAFDDAVKNMEYVIHTATPVFPSPIRDVQADIIQPAIRSTAELLESTQRNAAQVKQVVLTSSLAACIDEQSNLRGYDKVIDETCWSSESIDSTSDILAAYRVSKKFCEKV